MAKHLLIIANEAIRAKAMHWLAKAPIGYRITFQEAKRSVAQSDLMWALLSDVASQKTHMGNKYDTETWKKLFMTELGHEIKFIPTLSGGNVMPLGHRSSELSKVEMSNLIEFIYAWGSHHGVRFHDEKQVAA